MDSISGHETKYVRFKVGLGAVKKLYICKEEDIMRYPESLLAKCLDMFKEDGRTKGNYIEIPHEGKHFKDIIRFMAGYKEPLYKNLSSQSLLDEMRYHCLDIVKPKYAYTFRTHSNKTTRACTPGLRIEVFRDMAHLTSAIEYTPHHGIIILNYLNNRGTKEALIHARSGMIYLRTLMRRVDLKKCRVIGFEGDMLGLGSDNWKQSVVVLGWREEPKYALGLRKWHHNLVHRECLLEKWPISHKDLGALIDGL